MRYELGFIRDSTETAWSLSAKRLIGVEVRVLDTTAQPKFASVPARRKAVLEC